MRSASEGTCSRSILELRIIDTDGSEVLVRYRPQTGCIAIGINQCVVHIDLAFRVEELPICHAVVQEQAT